MSASRPPAPTRELAQFAAGLAFDALPAEVVAHLKLLVLDSLGCGIHGSTTPEGRLVAECALDWSRNDEATVWGGGRTAAANAALANATATQAFTFDDIHHASGSHPGTFAVAPGLALAERLGGMDGRRWLTALAAGYEVGCRVGAPAMPAARLRGFHPVGVFGPLGAAATCARLLGLDEGRTLHALGTAGTQGAGLMSAQFDSMVHRLHAGKAAQAGLVSADLAARGFRGVTDVLEAPYGGLYGSLAGDGEVDASSATAGLGREWVTLDVALRPYACAGSATTSVDGVLDLQREHGFRADDVAEVAVRASEMIRSHCGFEYRPSELIGAQMSIPYGVAVALLDGRAGVEQYAAARLADPAVLGITARVRVEHEPTFDRSPPELLYRVAVVVALRDGRRLSIESHAPRGSRARPLSRADVEAKFRALAGTVLDDERVERVRVLVDDLERLQDLRSLGQLLGASRGPEAC